MREGNDWPFLIDGRVRTVAVASRFRTSGPMAAYEAAAQGMGIALLPDHACREYLEKKKLVRIFPDWQSPGGFVHVVFTARKGLPLAARAFVDHLVSIFAAGALLANESVPRITPSERGKSNGHALVEAI